MQRRTTRAAAKPKGAIPARNRTAKERASDALWDWALSEVTDPSLITSDHLLQAYGFSARVSTCFPLHVDSTFAAETSSDLALLEASEPSSSSEPPSRDLPRQPESSDVNVDGTPPGPSSACTKNQCRSNPNCLNHLGQEKLRSEESAWKLYIKHSDLGDDPAELLRDVSAGEMVGLRNLGATCYVNAYIQVWFRNKKLSQAILDCVSRPETPLYQLQITLAALQHSTSRVYDPTPLVKSLALDPSEQQDAQEFSKLLLSYVADELSKQPKPLLQSLVKDEFEGTQSYEVRCKKCQQSSIRSAAFLELEFNLQRSSTLEENIDGLLVSEDLSGSNQYACSACNSHQDATRQLSFSRFPPILQISLLRFKYDYESGTRKKTNHNISFPAQLDMQPYISPSPDGSVVDPTLYDLDAVLCHKGTSAYQGHYEAQLFNASDKTWTNVSDETITFMGSSLKTAAKGTKSKTETPSDRFDSKDAYMLIYRRKDSPSESSSSLQVRDEVLSIVESLNQSYAKDSVAYGEKKEALRQKFLNDRSKRMEMCSSWSPRTYEEVSMVMDRTVLESILLHGYRASESASESAPSTEEAETKPDESTPEEAKILQTIEQQSLPNAEKPSGDALDGGDDIICPHQKLDPLKIALMKRVSMAGYKLLLDLIGKEKHLPELTTNDVCRECVTSIFTERVYAVEHPESVRQFDDCPPADGGQGVWVPADWLKDWRRSTPKFHVKGAADPSPDDPLFRSGVYCSHGQIAADTSKRVLINDKAADVLHGVFPDWSRPKSSLDECAMCLVQQKELKDMKTIANREKIALKAFAKSSISSTSWSPNQRYFILPSSFVTSWKEWIANPSTKTRPASIDNSLLMCAHGLLAIDPMDELDMGGFDVWVTGEKMWGELVERYSCQHPVSVTLMADTGEGLASAAHPPVVNMNICEPCRSERLRNWEQGKIRIRVLRQDEPYDPTGTSEPSSSTSEHSLVNTNTDNASIVAHATPDSDSPKDKPVLGTKRPRPSSSYGTNGTGTTTRRSKRLRANDPAQPFVFVVDVKRTDKLMDVKQKVMDKIHVPPAQQRVFSTRTRAELTNSNPHSDGSANGNSTQAQTLGELGLHAHDELIVQVPLKSSNGSEDDSGAGDGASYRGFAGTALGGGESSTHKNSKTNGDAMDIDGVNGDVPMLNCPDCTFANLPTADRCEICSAPL